MKRHWMGGSRKLRVSKKASKEHLQRQFFEGQRFDQSDGTEVETTEGNQAKLNCVSFDLLVLAPVEVGLRQFSDKDPRNQRSPQDTEEVEQEPWYFEFSKDSFYD